MARGRRRARASPVPTPAPVTDIHETDASAAYAAHHFGLCRMAEDRMREVAEQGRHHAGLAWDGAAGYVLPAVALVRVEVHAAEKRASGPALWAWSIHHMRVHYSGANQLVAFPLLARCGSCCLNTTSWCDFCERAEDRFMSPFSSQILAGQPLCRLCEAAKCRCPRCGRVSAPPTPPAA